MSLDAISNRFTTSDQFSSSEQRTAYSSFLNELMTPSVVGANTTQDTFKSALDKVPSLPNFSVGDNLESLEALTPSSEYEKQIFNAGSAAYDKFPVLREIGASRELIGKIGLYEYRNRSSYGTDWAQDRLLNLPESVVPNGTYGPYQISLQSFYEAKRQYPNQLGNYKLADLLNPEKAAVVCGAFLATRAEEFKRGNFRGADTVSHFYNCGDHNRALVLSYNPGEGKFREGGNYDGRQRSSDCLAQTP